MPSPSDFGINLSSTSYTSSSRNPFAAVPNPSTVSAHANYMWCTEFAFGRAVEKGLINANSGVGAKIRRHAGLWDDQAGTWSKQPRANSFIVWDAGTGGASKDYGHVAFVERVNSDGSITITEGNWGIAGLFSSRTLSPNDPKYRAAKFIHLGGSTVQPPVSPPPSGGRVLQGTQGSERIDGSNYNDTLIGAGGNDTLYGEAGNDFLTGGDGNDYLDGYASFISRDFDTLEGGAGIDTFVLGNTRQGAFYKGDGHAVIADYNFRDDYIQLQGNAGQYQLVRQGNDTLIQQNGDLMGIVKNVTDLSLYPRPGRMDFKFV